jgi:hypothetical protein
LKRNLHFLLSDAMVSNTMVAGRCCRAILD